MNEGTSRLPCCRVALSVAALACLVAVVVGPGRAGAQPTRSHSCGFISFPKVNEGGAMEFVVAGPGHLPSCHQARRRLRSVPGRLSRKTWGTVGGWRCRWSRYWVSCERRRVSLEAYNGGD